MTLDDLVAVVLRPNPSYVQHRFKIMELNLLTDIKTCVRKIGYTRII